MDEYDVLLYEINREKKLKEEKKFWRGKKWTEKQIEEMSALDKPPLKINKIKSGQEIQREQMRKQMGLTDTKGLTLTKNNMEKLFFELNNCCITGNGGLFSKGVFYEDFIHFSSALIKKYFTKEKKNESQM